MQRRNSFDEISAIEQQLNTKLDELNDVNAQTEEQKKQKQQMMI